MHSGSRILRVQVLGVVCGFILLAGLSAQAAVLFPWATVDRPGNAADTTGYGTVNSIFEMAAHEVPTYNTRSF